MLDLFQVGHFLWRQLVVGLDHTVAVGAGGNGLAIGAVVEAPVPRALKYMYLTPGAGPRRRRDVSLLRISSRLLFTDRALQPSSDAAITHMWRRVCVYISRAVLVFCRSIQASLQVTKRGASTTTTPLSA